MNSWSHLPNAVYIDRILEHMNSNQEYWVHTEFKEYDENFTAFVNARDLSYDIGRGDIWDDVTDKVLEAIKTTFNVSMNAVSALIAHDDCGYMLDSDPGELQILAEFGNPTAILMLPACIALRHSVDK